MMTATEGCRIDTPRCAEATSYRHVLPACCRALLVELLADVVSALDGAGVTWWADYGTLLGAVRNPLTTAADYPWLAAGQLPLGEIPPGIIPHDKDADLGVLGRDMDALEAAMQELRERGRMVTCRRKGGMVKVRVSAIHHQNVDLFPWHAAGDGTLGRFDFLQCDAFKGRRFPSAWLEPGSAVTWEGLELRGPADPVAFCAFRYGDGWRVPVPANHDGIRRA